MSVNFEVSGLLVTGMGKIRDGSCRDTPRLTPGRSPHGRGRLTPCPIADERHRSFALIQGAGAPARVMAPSAERFEEGPNITISTPDISTAMPMYHA
jgi:hypothetical protein